MIDKIKLRQDVERSIQSQWADFAREHPKLAAVIDQELVVAGATEYLSENPEFIAALNKAQSVNDAGRVLYQMVHEHVVKWIRRLI